LERVLLLPFDPANVAHAALRKERRCGDENDQGNAGEACDFSQASFSGSMHGLDHSRFLDGIKVVFRSAKERPFAERKATMRALSRSERRQCAPFRGAKGGFVKRD
jgi:hypothetical protein